MRQLPPRPHAHHMPSDPELCTACGSRLVSAPDEDAARTLCDACSRQQTIVRSVPTGDSEESTLVRPRRSGSPQTVTRSQPPSDPDATVDYPRAAGETRHTGFVTDGGVAGGDESDKFVGRFQIRSVLGRGAFGVVYRAFDPLLDREVALKCPLFSQEATDMQERFVREAKAAAKLRHPNIVGLFETGQTRTGPYIATEFVDGTPLSHVIKTRDVEIRTAVDWVQQIASGLHYAHEQGIVHRDVKPANMMVNSDGVPQIMDFGLAKQEGDSVARMTLEGTILGTPAYMAPEQARGELGRVGPHSDQYSVGVVLYELLSGRTPYVGDAWSIMSQAGNVNAQPPAPRTLKAEVPPDLEACCLKAMSKESSDRYATLEDFADDLEAWLDGRPLEARPLGPIERLSRWCKRNRGVAALTFSLASLLLIAAIVGPVLAFQFQHLAADNRKQAEDAENARSREAASRLAAERLLVDSLTESGLTAAENGEFTSPLVWFANAAVRSKNLPDREKYNRTRFLSWLATVALPFQAWSAPGDQPRELHWHPSGSHLMTVSIDQELEIRDAETGRIIDSPVTGKVSSACWNATGDLLAIASGDRVSVYRFATGEVIDQWADADHPVVSCRFAGDDGLVIGRDSYARVRNVASKRFLTKPVQHDAKIRAVVLSPGKRRLATHAENKLRVFDVETGDLVYGPVEAESDFNIDCPPSFISDDRIVATCNRQKMVWCYDVGKKAEVWQHPIERAFAVRVSPDRTCVAVADGRLAVIRNARSGDQIGEPIEHKNLVVDVAFNPDGTAVLTSSLDQTARVSRVSDGSSMIRAVPHTDGLRFGEWSPDGMRFATAEMTKQGVRIWRSKAKSTGSYDVPIKAKHSYFKFIDSQNRLFATGFDGLREHTGVQVRDAATGASVGPWIRTSGIMSDAAIVPGSPCVVLVGSHSAEAMTGAIAKQKMHLPGVIQFRHRDSGQELHPDVEAPSTPLAVEASRDGKVVAVLCYMGQLLLVSPDTGKVLFKSSVGDEATEANCGFVIRSRLLFSPDSETVVVWGSDNVVEARDAETGVLRFRVRHEDWFVHDAIFSPSGEVLATCGSDGSVRIWDAESGKPVGSDLKHAGWVFSADFSDDGQLLATACEDYQVRVWDWQSGRLVSAPLEHQDQVFSVSFLPNGETLATGARDGTLGIWERLTGKQLVPPRQTGRMVYQVGVSGDGEWLIAAGRLLAIKGTRLQDWVKRDRLPDLASTDLRLLAEVVSGERLDDTGGMTALSSEEWHTRWRSVVSSPALLDTLRSDD